MAKEVVYEGKVSYRQWRELLNLRGVTGKERLLIKIKRELLAMVG